MVGLPGLFGPRRNRSRITSGGDVATADREKEKEYGAKSGHTVHGTKLDMFAEMIFIGYVKIY